MDGDQLDGSFISVSRVHHRDHRLLNFVLCRWDHPKYIVCRQLQLVDPPRSTMWVPDEVRGLGTYYGSVQISWRGGFFHYFFRSPLYFRVCLARRLAPQQLTGLA